jgi:transposase
MVLPAADRRHQHEAKRSPKNRAGSKQALPEQLDQVNLYAAGIDVGASSHFVAVPKALDGEPVREFSCFTGELNRLADWLVAIGITTVAMESTGVYWIPLFEILEGRGLEVLLVDARRVKNVPGRKTDVLDCQWLQQLHTYGLLHGAFRPADPVCALRAYLRQRDTLTRNAATHIQHMQKALAQMNLRVDAAVSDITGATGMRIIRAILDGERDPQVLAGYRDPRCKNSVQAIAAALEGNYRDEHLFALRQSVELWDFYGRQIAACDAAIERHLGTFETEVDPEQAPLPPSKKCRARNAPAFDLRTEMYRILGVDLTRIDGIEAYSAVKIISEIGLDMSRWPSEKQFTSWLGLCPGSKVSGGKRLGGRSKRSANRAAEALRLAAHSLHRSKTALGAYLRRQKARLGAPKAITATARKLAIIVYHMLKEGTEYVDAGESYYEEQYRQRAIRNLHKRAQSLGFDLTPLPQAS